VKYTVRFYLQGGRKTVIHCQILRLRNDLYCVEWGVKLYSLTHCRIINKSYSY